MKSHKNTLDNDVARRVIEDLKIVRGGLINKDEFIEAALKSQVNKDISRYCICTMRKQQT